MASVYLPGFIAIIIMVALVFSIYYSGKALKLWSVPKSNTPNRSLIPIRTMI